MQADAIAIEDPDVVALQEVTTASDPQWRAALAERGFTAIASTTRLLGDNRRYANLIAARWPLHVLAFDDPVDDWPERHLSVVLESPAWPVVIHVFHAPTGVGAGWGKVRALEALHRRMKDPSDAPQVVCGDFNAPQDEPPNAPLRTIAQHPEIGELRSIPERWYRAVEPTTPWKQSDGIRPSDKCSIRSSRTSSTSTGCYIVTVTTFRGCGADAAGK